MWLNFYERLGVRPQERHKDSPSLEVEPSGTLDPQYFSSPNISGIKVKVKESAIYSVMFRLVQFCIRSNFAKNASPPRQTSSEAARVKIPRRRAPAARS